MTKRVRISKALGLLLVLSAFIAGCSAFDAASFSSTPFYKGDVAIQLDRQEYFSGEVLIANLTVANIEEFPMAPASLILELSEGGLPHVYPAHISDVDNVFFETVIGNISLGPLSKKTVNFSYELPKDLKGGSYKLEAYLRTDRAPIVGIVHILLAPVYKSFNVTGQGDYPYAKFSRIRTIIGNESGQIGSPVSPGVDVSGVISMDSSRSLAGHIVYLTVCEWDDTACTPQEALSIARYSLARDDRNITVTLKAPKKPNAYAIRLELKDDAGRLVSLYRGRLIVEGKASRIKKLSVDRSYYSAGMKGNISVLIGPSPDHYSFPVVKGAELTVSLNSLGKNVFMGSYDLPELSINNGMVYKNFEFKASRDLSGFELCSKIKSAEGEIFDEYCYTVEPASEVHAADNMSIEWNYDKTCKTIGLKLCAKNLLGATARARTALILLRVDDRSPVGLSQSMELVGCNEAVFNASAGEYILLVNDQDRNVQYSFNINVPEEGTALTSLIETTTSLGSADPSAAGGNDNLGYVIAVLAAILLVIAVMATRKKSK